MLSRPRGDSHGRFGATAVALVGAGLAVPERLGEAAGRLRSVLWAAAVVATGAFLVVLSADVLDRYDEHQLWIVGGGTAVVAAVLWWMRRTWLQQLALFVPLMLAAAGTGMELTSTDSAWAGATMWGVAAVWAVAANTHIDYARRPETEIEVCSSCQSVEAFARGEGVWQGLVPRVRREQIEHMAGLVDELYPTYRWFLFDERERVSVPFSVFGPKRAAIYVGDMYFVFTSTEHIRALSRHFDGLVRHARVQANDCAAFLRGLLRHVR